MAFKYNASAEIAVSIPAGYGTGFQNITGIDITSNVGSLSYTYPPAQALTLLAPGLCGLLSVLSISSLFGYIGYKHFSGSSSGKAASNFFIRNPLGIVLLSLFITDLFGGISWTVMIAWAAKRKMHQGAACSFSGIAEQIGSLGAGVWNLLLSVLTFSVLVLNLRLDTKMVWMLLSLGWVFIFVVVIAGPLAFHFEGYPMERFYSPGNTWCWMGGNGQTTKSFILLTEIVCVTAAITSLILYIIIYLRLSGRLHVTNGRISMNWAGKSSHHTETRVSSGGGNIPTAPQGGKTVGGVSHVESIGKQVIDICKKLLFYPIIYIIVITPIAAARLFFFTHPFSSGIYVDWRVNMMAAAIEASSGFLNTILFIFTRHSLVIRPTAPLTGVQITTTRFVAEDYSSGDRSNNFNLRSMGGTKSKNPRVDSKGSDEDLQADFETANALDYSNTNPSRTSLPQSANGAISDIELGRQPEAHAQRGVGNGY
ncbi:hypothetical protein BDY24DRAFT_441550 [Mrakia frigida]|uniref:uncharacterized protein n=1 Tax=Mrakia frigida TaxID=29902 RepID=UPI003FCC1C8F